MYYTRDQILEMINHNGITTLSQFRTSFPAVYLWYSRHKTEVGELPLSRQKRANYTLNEEVVANIALKYKHRSDFQNGDKGAYAYALRNSLLDKVCSHMLAKETAQSVRASQLAGKAAVNRIDLTGRTYNSWLVRGPDKERSHGKIVYWICKCLECGTEGHSVRGQNIRNGGSKRCGKCSSKYRGEQLSGKTITKRTPEESAHYYLFMQLRKSAFRNGHSWEISEAHVRSLVTANCHYCKRPPGLSCSPLKHHGLNQKKTEAATLVRNGIDRQDSSLGYTFENTVSCCKICNNAKSDMPLQDFLAWAKDLGKAQGS